jgi:hypothetical protein
MSTIKTPINYYIQDNFLYDADEITLDRMDDGLIHHVQGNKIVTSEYEECHGLHLIETLEIDLQSATTMFIEDGQIRHKIEHIMYDLNLFDRLVESLISKGMI